MGMSENIRNKFRALEALVSNTPMVEIKIKYRNEYRNIYAKMEYYNYSGSIKDRVALHILKHAYEEGLILEGQPLAEATSGNVGISFAALGAYLGNPVTIFMPDWMSKERFDLIGSFGATIRKVSKEQGGFTGCIKLADQMGAEEGVFLPHQFSNPINVDTHYRSTGKEIISQLEAFGKKPDGVVAGVGTGGTVMGIKKALQEVFPTCKAFPLDPENSQIMASGGTTFASHRIAGIGDEFIPDILKLKELDDIVMVDDGDAINMARKLARVFGLGVGISSGANFLGVIKSQDILGSKDAVVVTVFADDNKKYLSTDLMFEQPYESGHMTPDVELIDFRAIRI